MESNSHGNQHGFTLIELLVVVGIITILLSVLIPTMAKIRDAARTASCLSNQRQIGLAIATYAADHHGCLVPGDYVGIIDGYTQAGAGSWADILVEERYITATFGSYSGEKWTADFPDGAMQRDTILRCPAGIEENGANNYPISQTDARGAFFFVRGSDTTHHAVHTWYAVNCTPRTDPTALSVVQKRTVPFNFLPDFLTGSPDWHVTRLVKLKATMPLIFDGLWCFNGDPNRINARHGNRRYTNLLFADGHCESQVTTTLPNENWYVR